MKSISGDISSITDIVWKGTDMYHIWDDFTEPGGVNDGIEAVITDEDRRIWVSITYGVEGS